MLTVFVMAGALAGVMKAVLSEGSGVDRVVGAAVGGVVGAIVCGAVGLLRRKRRS